MNFTHSPHIRPVYLPGSEEVDYYDVLATVTGWGHQKKRYLSQILQEFKNKRRMRKGDLDHEGESQRKKPQTTEITKKMLNTDW